MNNNWVEYFEENILKTKKLANKLCEKWTHIYDCSWIIKNIIWDKCRWYCVEKSWIPIICWKNEKCNNFKDADEIAQKNNQYLSSQNISDIY